MGLGAGLRIDPDGIVFFPFCGGGRPQVFGLGGAAAETFSLAVALARDICERVGCVTPRTFGAFSGGTLSELDDRAGALVEGFDLFGTATVTWLLIPVKLEGVDFVRRSSDRVDVLLTRCLCIAGSGIKILLGPLDCSCGVVAGCCRGRRGPLTLFVDIVLAGIAEEDAWRATGKPGRTSGMVMLFTPSVAEVERDTDVP